MIEGFCMTASQNILTLIHEVAILYPIFLLLYSFRGFCIATIAAHLGDKSAQRKGFLTLNPFAHIDVILLAFFMIIPYLIDLAFDSITPRACIFMSVVGFSMFWVEEPPVHKKLLRRHYLTDIFLSFISSFIFFFIGFLGLLMGKYMLPTFGPAYITRSLQELTYSFAHAAIFLGALHCIPVPPLYASGILYSLLPRSTHKYLDAMKLHGPITLLVVTILPVVSSLFWGSINYIQLIVKTAFTSILL